MEISLFTVSRHGRQYRVEGDIYLLEQKQREAWDTLHKTPHEAEWMASIMTTAVIEQAEEANARFDRVRAYLAQRRARVPVPSPQLTLF
jgi:hypothetical protein